MQYFLVAAVCFFLSFTAFLTKRSYPNIGKLGQMSLLFFAVALLIAGVAMLISH